MSYADWYDLCTQDETVLFHFLLYRIRLVTRTIWCVGVDTSTSESIDDNRHQRHHPPVAIGVLYRPRADPR
jgi:hypothetical protein